MKSSNKSLLHPFYSSTCTKTTEPLSWGGSGPRPQRAWAARAPAGCAGRVQLGAGCYDAGSPASLGSLSHGAAAILAATCWVPLSFLWGCRKSGLNSLCPTLPVLPLGIAEKSLPAFFPPSPQVFTHIQIHRAFSRA